jgi:hypothetical protein
MIPPFVLLSSSTRLIRILSCNGLTFMLFPPSPLKVVLIA